MKNELMVEALRAQRNEALDTAAVLKARVVEAVETNQKLLSLLNSEEALEARLKEIRANRNPHEDSEKVSMNSQAS